MEHATDDAEALRRALYRPGASADDLDTYLAVAVEPEPDVEAPPPAVADRRRWLWAAGAIAVVALVGVAIASGALESAPSVAASPSPVRTVAVDPGTGQPVPLPSVVDHGARRSAMGTAMRMGNGQYLYTVAAGDTVPGIAGRFRLCDADVLVSLPYGFDAGAIPPGKQLLLSRAAAAGMCRVGGVRG